MSINLISCEGTPININLDNKILLAQKDLEIANLKLAMKSK